MRALVAGCVPVLSAESIHRPVLKSLKRGADVVVETTPLVEIDHHLVNDIGVPPNLNVCRPFCVEKISVI